MTEFVRDDREHLPRAHCRKQRHAEHEVGPRACHTQQPADQVVMFSARRAGPAGERGDSVGTYMCSDLMCQETVRLGRPAAPSEVLPSVHELERIEGLARRTRAFVADVLGAA